MVHGWLDTTALHRYLVMKNLSRFVVLAAILTISFSSYGAQQTGQAKDHKAGSEEHQSPMEEEPDPLGRSTPHGTVFGFLQRAQSGNYREAARYLQLSKDEQLSNAEQLSRQLLFLMDHVFVGRVSAISEGREGSVQEDVPRDHERIGIFRVNDHEIDIELVRITDPQSGEIWLFPSTLLAQVPELYDQIEISQMESRLPRFLRTERLFSTPLWRLISFLFLIPLAFVAAFGFVKLLQWRIRSRRTTTDSSARHPDTSSWFLPTMVILTIGFHQLAVYLLGMPLLMRVYYQRFVGVILLASSAWLVIRLVDLWAERERLKALAGSGYRNGSIILLGQRILKVFVIIVAGLFCLSLFGFDVSNIVAGLGIGSIAVAFAAQKTLENLLGGISILGDEVIRVGDFCRIGEQEGTIQNISLRSTRIRTSSRTEVSIPNGQLANMDVENLSRRETRLFEEKVELSRDTSSDQLRVLLSEMRELLVRRPEVESDSSRVRFTGFGDNSLIVEIHCHLLVSELEQFLALREDLLLELMSLFAAKGVALAVPTQSIYVRNDEQSQSSRHEVSAKTGPFKHAA